MLLYGEKAVHFLYTGFYFLYTGFSKISKIFIGATLGPWNRSIECPNTCGTVKNGFPMKKYIGAVVRKSFQLPIDAERGHFENKSPCTKNSYLSGGLKKTKLYCVTGARSLHTTRKVAGKRKWLKFADLLSLQRHLVESKRTTPIPH